jgi:hypothetical protein
MHRFASFLLAAAAACCAQVAFAQPTTPSEDNYAYRFDDDYMVGDTLSTTPPLIIIRKKPLRVQLIRPRASFVTEMLKSVEAL